jgi:hypothetical protein
MSPNRRGRPPSTNNPLDALSATVSTIEMSHSAMRLSDRDRLAVAESCVREEHAEVRPVDAHLRLNRP